MKRELQKKIMAMRCLPKCYTKTLEEGRASEKPEAPEKEIARLETLQRELQMVRTSLGMERASELGAKSDVERRERDVEFISDYYNPLV